MTNKDKIYSLKNAAVWCAATEISKEVLDNPDFALASGSGKPDQHHYGDGGLLQHTLEVVELCLQNADYFNRNLDKNISKKNLFLAALFHDVGKIWDYEKVFGFWRHAPHKKLIHHISKSAIIWVKAAEKHKYPEKDTEEVLHAILSHHGQKAWGSPVEPQTNIAFLLHLCDSISARMDDCETNKLYK